MKITSVEWNSEYILHGEIRNDRSPILFTNIARMEALLAWQRVNQKFMSRYEQIPTPSQAKKICSGFDENTRSIIKNVNRPEQLQYLGRCGSVDIYSNEYICANMDIETIGRKNKIPNESDKKLNCIDTLSTDIQSDEITYASCPVRRQCARSSIESVYNKKLFPTATISVPDVPKYFPNRHGIRKELNATAKMQYTTTTIIYNIYGGCQQQQDEISRWLQQSGVLKGYGREQNTITFQNPTLLLPV